MAMKKLFKTSFGEQGSIVWPLPLEQGAEDSGQWLLIGRNDRKGRSK